MQDTDLTEDFQSMRRQDREWHALKLIGVGAAALGAALLVIYALAWRANDVQDHHGPAVQRDVTVTSSVARA